MTGLRRMTAAIILLTIAGIFVFTAALDFSRFLGYYSFYNLCPTYLINRINVILAAVLVWIAGRDSQNREDHRLMILITAVICMGEAFFLLSKPIAAVSAFALCQCMLIIRHGKGLIHKLSQASLVKKSWLLLWAVVLAAVIFTTVTQLPLSIRCSPLSIAAVSYWAILSISLWTALANMCLGLFPKTNSKMIAAGMLCFYFCDICVGLDVLLPDGTLWLLANSLIWVFYTPAITLLALSCYKYNAGYSLSHIL